MGTDPPLITAVIPTYRRPTLLRRAIRSALNQTYPHLRVAIYDNASGDETAATVAEIARADDRVVYHCHPENIGSSANFAYGMAHVETPYFSMLSDDDVYFPSFYETAMAGFTRHPDAHFSAGASVAMYDSGHILACSTSDGYFTPPDGFLQWVQGAGPSITGMLFRREIVEAVGFLDPAIYHSDIDYLWRIASRFPFVTSREPALVYLLHAQQGTRQSAMETWRESYVAIRARVHATPGVSAHVLSETDRFLTATFSWAIFYPALHAITDGDYARARSAAATLRAPFGQGNRATALDLLAGACERLPPLRVPVRALLRTAQRANGAIATARRDRAHATLRGAAERLLRDLETPSAREVISPPRA